MKKVALISLGCAKNLVDSEVMAGYLIQAGYKLISDWKNAEIIVINTCGFIQPARAEAEEHLQKITTLKKKNPQIKIIASGCYVEKDKTVLQKKYPAIDIWTGVKDFQHIVPLIEEKQFSSSKKAFLYTHSSPRCLSTPSSWAYVKIAEGCPHRCSFCTIPQIKGPYQSRSISSIVSEVKSLASRGIKEVNLISQDTTYFGRDMGLKQGLCLLLETLLSIQEIQWIRILYAYPEEITDALLDIMQEEKICSYLDLPFQHADKEIIEKMKRGYDGNQAIQLIQKIRHKLPDIALRTSLIVGFPGEGKKEFEELKKFVNEAKFDHVGVFPYFREKSTISFDMGDPVSPEEKEERKGKIMELQAAISFDNNKKYLHKQIHVLLEGSLKEDPRILVGRASFQAPEVDGVVYVDSENQTLKIPHPMQKVEITESDVYDLYGKFITQTT